MLKAYGVGDEKATVLAATFTWLLKGSLGYTLRGTPTPNTACPSHSSLHIDGAGMVGRIMFTWLKGLVIVSDLTTHIKALAS
jgi:hypothetical protein